MTAQAPVPNAATRVLVWGENRHEQIEPHVAAIYPDGMHTTIAAGIAENLGTLLRYETGDFFTGHGYGRAIAEPNGAGASTTEQTDAAVH